MIIIVDLDATLLTSDKKITDYTLEVFRRAQEKGHKIVVNTARSLKLTYKYSKMLNADFIVCFNGNLVLDKYGKIYAEKKLNEKTAEALINFAREENLKNIRIDTRYKAYSNSNDYCMDYNYEYVSTENLLDLAPQTFTLLFENDGEIDFSKMNKIAEENDVVFGWSRNFELSWFMPKGSEKWNGVKIAIAEICKNEKHKTVAFGDELTDVETFLNVDYPVPLINASEEVLKLFNTTTKYDNDNNGVAVWVDENLLV